MTEQERNQWLENRNKGIGGSDLAALLGISPYKSTYELWLEKTGQIKPKDISDKLPVKVGTALEPLVIKEFQEQTGLIVEKSGEIIQHPEHSFMTGTLDATGTDPQGKKFILECKTTNAFNTKEWEDDEIPLHYEFQVLHYLTISNYDYGYIACLIGNSKFIYKKIEIDETQKHNIILYCKKFWNMVETKTPPPVDGSKSCTELLKEMYPNAETNSIIHMPDPNIDKKFEELNNLERELKDKKEQEKEIQNEIDKIKNEFRDILKENETLRTDNHECSWKNQTASRLDQTELKNQMPEIHSKFQKISQTRVLKTKKIA